jgi:hypothetical protein
MRVERAITYFIISYLGGGGDRSEEREQMGRRWEERRIKERRARIVSGWAVDISRGAGPRRRPRRLAAGKERPGLICAEPRGQGKSRGVGGNG